MILVGNQRGGASNLAHHLMKDENEHVEVHSIRGFASENLHGALNEAYAMSRGTRCRQFLFSLSLNPPAEEKVETRVFEETIARAEAKLGLSGQPRAIVFHEKEGRRHAHAVWSRIDAENMRAIQISYSRFKLRDLSRELYLEHGWKMPRGYVVSEERNVKNFSLAEWQQAKRIGQDPRAIKAAFQDAWAISDSKAAFISALEERGYKLAQGKRGFVGVDMHGEVHSIARRVGIKTKDVRQRLGDSRTLPGVEKTKELIAGEMLTKLGGFQRQLKEKSQERRTEFARQRNALVMRQREERQTLSEHVEQRRVRENIERQARFRPGVKGVWDRLRGEHRRIQKQNEAEALQGFQRDRQEKDRLVFRQIEQRQNLQRRYQYSRAQFIRERQALRQDTREYRRMAETKPNEPASREEFVRRRQETTRPTQPRIRGPDRSPSR